MKVLLVSLDHGAAMDKRKYKVIGDVQQRLVEYGKYFSKIFVIVFSLKKMNLVTQKLGNNVLVYPTSSYSKLLIVFDALKIASKILKKEAVNLISVQDPFLCGIIGYLLKKLYKVPFVVQIHADVIDNYFWLQEKKMNYVLNLIGKYIVKRADGVQVVSTKIKNHCIEVLGIPYEKVHLIPVYVDIERFQKPVQKDLRQKYDKYENIILFVGRLIKQKNLPNLLIAASIVLKEFPKTLFLIVGDGPERAKLENMTKKIGIEENVIFEGYVNNVIDYYNICDIFVLPSNYEGRSVAQIEAFACKKPVISTEVSGAHDVILDGKTGYIVAPNKPIELAWKILELIKNPEKRKQMGENAYQFALKTQDIKANAIKLKEIYERVAKYAAQGV